MGGSGSPPPARGGLEDAAVDRNGERLTPACAARTWSRTPYANGATAHPRLGGEDLINGEQVGGSYGSPPPARGGRPDHGLLRPPGRLTPACAGRPPCAPKARRDDGSPPPARGGRS